MDMKNLYQQISFFIYQVLIEILPEDLDDIILSESRYMTFSFVFIRVLVWWSELAKVLHGI